MTHNEHPYAFSRRFANHRVGEAVQTEGCTLVSCGGSQVWFCGKSACNCVELIKGPHDNASAGIFPVSTTSFFDVTVGLRMKGVAHPYLARSLSTIALRITNFCALPVTVIGISVTNRKCPGTLSWAIGSWQTLRNSHSVAAEPGFKNTHAQTYSPYLASGKPNTCTCATAGCRNKDSATSRGQTFSPPRMSRSFMRPTVDTRMSKGAVGAL